MDERIYELLNDEIEAKFGELEGLDVGSEEYSKVMSNIKDLYKLRIEDRKLNIESLRNATDANLRDRQLDNDDKQKSLEIELKDRQLAHNADQLGNQKIDNYLKLGVEVAGIVLPLMFYASWMKKGLKFEETGTFTSNTFKSLFQKFKPTR